MNLHLTDREKQAAIAALESIRSRKQAAITTSSQYKKDSPTYKELRQPENEYDILSAEHTLMHVITLLSKLTSRPIEHFMNPNPSQLPEPKIHTDGTGPVPTPCQQFTTTLEGAEKFFLENGTRGILCKKSDGSALACNSYPEAVAFYEKP